MAIEKQHNELNGHKWILAFIALIGSAIGTGGSTYYYFSAADPIAVQKVVRPDPATGSELRRLETEVEDHLDNHPDQMNQFDRRITRLETQYAIILANQQRILNRLDRLNGD